MLTFSVSKSDLLRSVSLAAGSKGSRMVEPLLQCLLFKPVDGTINIHATDLQTSVVANLTVTNFEGEDAFAADADLLLDIVKNLPNQDVMFDYSSGKLTVRSGRATYNVPTVAGTDKFPLLEPDGRGLQFTIGTSVLREMLDRVSFCASSESAMRALHGVFFEAQNGLLRLVASDGYRLAVADHKLNINSEFDFILGLKSVKQLEKLLASTTEPEVRITFDHSTVSFNAGDVTMVARTIEDSFPDYKRVLPKTFKTKVVLNTDEFLEALLRVHVIARRGAGKVQIKISDDVMELSSQSPDFGEATESIAVTKQGADLTVLFNVRFLFEAVRHVSEKETEFNFVDITSPLEIRPLGVDDYFFIVLPMRA